MPEGEFVMLPTITVGTASISTYWLMFAVGVCAMGVLAVRRRARYGLNVPKALLFTLLLAVCGVAGTKILYILENWREVVKNGLALGGLSFFGAVFLIPLLMPLVGLPLGLKPGQTLDTCAPCVAVMIACMRVGCFLGGCCGGWAVTVGGFRFRWPTQAMESIGDFCILGLLLQMEERDAHPGRRYAVFLVGYGILRFFMEFLRDTPKEWMGLAHGQWFAIAGVLMGGAAFLREKRAAGKAS